MFDIFSFLSNDYEELNNHSYIDVDSDYNRENGIDQYEDSEGLDHNDFLTFDNGDSSFCKNSLVDLDNHHMNFGSNMMGDPYHDTQFIEMQQGMYSCAVASQKGVIESLLGKDVPEIELSYMAYKNGWYDPASGTMPEDMGKILEAFDIPIEQGYDYSVTDIYNAIQKGEKIIVGLDGSEIWTPKRDEQGNIVEQENVGHAVWLTGLYQDDGGNWFVVMNDTGIPDGQGEVVRIEDFLSAWSDFGNFAVITKMHDGNENAADNIDVDNHDQKFGANLGGYYYTGPNGEKLYKSDDGHIYDINNNKVG